MVIDDPSPPTRRDLRVFALLWLVFWIGLGLVAPRAGTAFLVAGAFTAACVLASFLFQREVPRRRQMIGILVPLALVALGLGSKWLGPGVLAGTSTRLVARLPFAGIGLAGMVAVLSSTTVGTVLYRGWMRAFLPVAWSVSHILLGLVYYGVLTPTSLLMRLVGRDPMQRTIDRRAASYWTARRPVTDRKRYFGQS